MIARFLEKFSAGVVRATTGKGPDARLCRRRGWIAVVRELGLDPPVRSVDHKPTRSVGLREFASAFNRVLLPSMPARGPIGASLPYDPLLSAPKHLVNASHRAAPKPQELSIANRYARTRSIMTNASAGCPVATRR